MGIFDGLFGRQKVEHWEKERLNNLKKCLKSKHPGVRWGAIEELRVIKGPREPRELEIIIGALENDDFYVRCEAIRILGVSGDKRAVEPLINVLSYNNDSVQVEVARALGRIGGLRAREALVYLSASESKSVRDEAARALKILRLR